MRTMFIILFTCLLISMQDGYSQSVKPWPIPSYNVPVNGSALFQETVSSSNDNTCGKRKIHVQVNCMKDAFDTQGDAQVWIYSLDGQDVLGPYYLNCGNTLEVEIDDREWGAYVQSDMEIYVSVWID